MAAHGPYTLLSGVLDELVEHGVLDPARRAGAEIPAWAAVHGLATLLTDGPLALLTAEERARAIERTSDFLLNGIKGAHARQVRGHRTRRGNSIDVDSVNFIGHAWHVNTVHIRTEEGGRDD